MLSVRDEGLHLNQSDDTDLGLALGSQPEVTADVPPLDGYSDGTATPRPACSRFPPSTQLPDAFTSIPVNIDGSVSNQRSHSPNIDTSRPGSPLGEDNNLQSDVESAPRYHSHPKGKSRATGIIYESDTDDPMTDGDGDVLVG